MQLAGQLFYHQGFWVQEGIRIDILAIEILAGGRGPTIANNNPIGINHGDNNKPTPVPQVIGLLVVGTKPSNKAHNQMTTIGLAGMYPARN